MKMRIFLFLAALFLQCTTVALAAPSVTENIENIDLNIKDHEMAVTFFGLSRGEATLIQGSNGENILVNTGGKDTEAELVRLLSLYDVKEITRLIVTNSDALYYDQIKHLISIYQIKELIALPNTLTELTENLNLTKGIVLKSWEEGAKSVLFPEMTAEVQFAGSEKDEGLDFTLDFFKSRLFLMTSFSHRAEQRLMVKNLGEINIFKVPNCGKEASISEKLIQQVNPQISILVSAEQDPDPDIVEDLHQSWSEIYSTQKHGTVTIKFTESNYEVFTIPVESNG
jgi:competence protein ComEC